MVAQVSCQHIQRTLIYRFCHPAVLLLGCLSLVSLLQLQSISAATSGIDFYQFWLGGKIALSGNGEALYSVEGRTRLGFEGVIAAHQVNDPLRIAASEQRRVLETYSTPFLYSVFGGFSSDNYTVDLQRYRMGLLACFVAAIVLFSRLLSLNAVTVLAALCFFLNRFEPLSSELRVGNVNSIQLFGLALYTSIRVCWKNRWKDACSGILLGLLLAFKPNLALILPLVFFEIVCRRQYRALISQIAGLVVGVLVAFVVSGFVFGGMQCWHSFYESLARMPDGIIRVDQGNISPQMLLRASIGTDFGLTMIPLVVCISIVALWVRRRQKFPVVYSNSTVESRRQLSYLALGCLLVVLLPPLAWLHYFIMTVPALLLVLPQANEEFVRMSWLRIAVCVLVWMTVAFNPLSFRTGGFTMQEFGMVTLTGVVLAFFVVFGGLYSNGNLPSEPQR
jgi:Glycosyltransferase family 87